MRHLHLVCVLLSGLMIAPAAEPRVAWDLTPPPGVKADNDFLNGLVQDLRTAPFDSQKTEDAVRDLTLAENRQHGVPTLCAAMVKPDFKALFGPSQIAVRLFKDGQKTLAMRMLPFLATVSERTEEPEGLAAFAWVTPQYRDLRVVPRLIQLLEHPSDMVRLDAVKALSQLTLVPAEKVTPAEMRAWQSRTKGKSAARIWHEGLASKDPRVAMAAATMAFDERDPDVVHALCSVLRCTDARLVDQARDLLERITGNDWGCKSEVPPADRVKLVAKLEKWWVAEKGRYKWVADRCADEKPADDGLVASDATVAVATDPHRELIEQLGSTKGLQSEQAEGRLMELGKEALPSLLNGLDDPNLVVRRKCDMMLKSQSKLDMGFDPRAEESVRGEAVARWKAWVMAQTAPAAAPPAQPAAATDAGRSPAPSPAKPQDKRKQLQRGL